MKKSFLLYIDTLEVLSALSDEDAGKLFKTIRSHVVGDDYEIPDSLKLVFILIKNQLDRDAEKWKKISELRAEQGKQGGLAKANKSKQMAANGSNSQQELASVADNVTVTVTDNVNDTVTVKGKNIPSEDGLKFSDWFNKQLPEEMQSKFNEKKKNDWATTYDKLMKMGYTKSQVVAATTYGREDEFWKTNFYSATKLFKLDKEGTRYIDRFLANANVSQKNPTPSSAQPPSLPPQEKGHVRNPVTGIWGPPIQ
jgi:hypothetical protein